MIKRKLFKILYWVGVLVGSGLLAGNLTAQNLPSVVRYSQLESTVNGQPFFPIGIYAVDATEFEYIARFGFNLVQTYRFYGLSDEDKQAFLDEAHRHGLMVYAHLDGHKDLNSQKIEQIKAVVSRFKNHPALYAWYLADEPSVKTMSPQTLSDLYQWIKCNDPNHPVFISNWELTNFADACDADMRQIYGGSPARNIVTERRYFPTPIRLRKTWVAILNTHDVNFGEPDSVLSVSPTTFYDGAKAGTPAYEQAARKARQVIDNLEAPPFPFTKSYPDTPEKVRANPYWAIAKGSNGVYFWLYQPPAKIDKRWGWYTFFQQPHLRECFRSSIRELNELKPYLMNPAQDSLSWYVANNSPIYVWTKRAHNRRIFIVVNESDKPWTGSIDLSKVSLLGIDRLQVYGEDRRILPMRQGKIVDTFKPNEAHVYFAVPEGLREMPALYPVDNYEEMDNHQPVDLAEWAKLKSTYVSWGTTDKRYSMEKPAETGVAPIRKLRLKAWRGEQVNAQWVVSSVSGIDGLNYSIGALHLGNRKVETDGNTITSGFVRYVMTDQFGDGKDIKGCSLRPQPYQLDSCLVADAIDPHTSAVLLPARSTRAVWMTIHLPSAFAPGVYHTTIAVKAGEKNIASLQLEVELMERKLPSPGEWKFHLDLWQNPFAIARIHHTELWSKEHFDAMRPYMKLYADAGGKVITTSIMHRPWNGQTYDPFETMVTWIKRVDGTWSFDYTIFDRWVEFMMSMGIGGQINCYTMIPWKLSFKYLDQATNTFQTLVVSSGDEMYAQLWSSLLRDFSNHLIAKGWLDKTYIAVDERPLPHMQNAIGIIKEVHKDLKIAFAGDLHPEIIDRIDDYSTAFRMPYTEDMKNRRRARGQTSTYYTCCIEDRPNTFTFSAPAESEWIGWYAAKENVDGYLRWALSSWVEKPLQDSRFRSWAGGDTYLIYPGARSSIRFQRLIEGIQAYEKIRILRAEFESKGDKASLRQLDALLSSFTEAQLINEGAATVLEKAKRQMNRF